MFGISGIELLLILVFAFLILGPDKLPEMAKTAGRAIARFRDAQKDMNEVLKENDLVDSKSGNPLSNPVDTLERVAKVAADGKGEEVMQKVTSVAAAAATSVIKPHEEGDAGADGADAPSADAGATAVEKDAAAPMSFAERKARYERERAAREAAAAKAAAGTGAEAAGAAGDAGAADAVEAAETAATDAIADSRSVGARLDAPANAAAQETDVREAADGAALAGDGDA